MYVLSKKNPQVKQVFESLIEELRAIVSCNKDAVVNVSIAKQSKSRKAEKYFHKLVGLIADETGVSAKLMKIEIKCRIGLIEKITVNNVEITTVLSTSDLTSADYSLLISETIKVCQLMNISYPVPEYYGYSI